MHDNTLDQCINLSSCNSFSVVVYLDLTLTLYSCGYRLSPPSCI